MPPWPATRWPLTFGPALLGLAAVASLLSCARGQDWTPQGVERQRRACARTKEFPPARTPGDTKTRFASLLAGESFQEFGPQVLSTDPLIVYFDTFMSEEEVAACEAEVSSLEFAKSKAGYGGNAQGRLSESAFCIHNCDSSDIVQKVQRRASNISGVPIENFDFMQALRYQEGNFLPPTTTTIPPSTSCRAGAASSASSSTCPTSGSRAAPPTSRMSTSRFLRSAAPPSCSRTSWTTTRQGPTRVRLTSPSP
mmetsp:Transcript_156049/g.478905  ORF Transcript_156049/g.478905 Transcript_156049/m.478905 type:complete len:253 (-) Transcript_156049:504-1262(-)